MRQYQADSVYLGSSGSIFQRDQSAEAFAKLELERQTDAKVLSDRDVFSVVCHTHPRS